jgi:hypothetical protein
MLTDDDPLYPNWDQDETAVVDNYGAQDPTVVADELVAAAEALAAAFDDVRGDQWSRPGRRGDGAAFTVDRVTSGSGPDVTQSYFGVGTRRNSEPQWGRVQL